MYNKNKIGKLEGNECTTLILLISDLNKKEGYLLGLSVLYISRKQFFFLLKSLNKVTDELQTHSLRFFLLISMKVSQCNVYCSSVFDTGRNFFSPSFTVLHEAIIRTGQMKTTAGQAA